MERWETIKEHPNYEISNLGEVRNLKTGRILSPHLNNGHKRVKVGGKLCYIDKLVGEAFPAVDETCECPRPNGVVTCRECSNRYEYDICYGEDDDFYCGHARR